jgi:hypothetical protein
MGALTANGLAPVVVTLDGDGGGRAVTLGPFDGPVGTLANIIPGLIDEGDVASVAGDDSGGGAVSKGREGTGDDDALHC